MQIRQVSMAQVEMSNIMDHLNEEHREMLMAWMRKWVHSGFMETRVTTQMVRDLEGVKINEYVKNSMASRIGLMVLEKTPIHRHFIDENFYLDVPQYPHYLYRADFTIIGEKNGIKG